LVYGGYKNNFPALIASMGMVDLLDKIQQPLTTLAPTQIAAAPRAPILPR
jgi:hypothetical protein